MSLATYVRTMAMVACSGLALAAGLLKPGSGNIILTGVYSYDRPEGAGSLVDTAERVYSQPDALRPATRVRSVRPEAAGGRVRVFVDADGTLRFKDFTLADPPRVVIDVIGVHNVFGNRTMAGGSASVKRVRVGQPRPGVVRLVLDVATGVPYHVARGDASLIITVGEPGPAVKYAMAHPDFGAVANLRSASELRGTVADQMGALIAGASVTLEGGRQHKYTTQTDEHGRYQFVSVMPGVYTLMVSAEGFAKLTRRVDLTERRTVSLDITLEVFIKEELEVNVNGAGTPTEREGNLSAIVLTGKVLEALPTDAGRLLERLREMAGSTGRPGDVTFYVDGFRGANTLRLPPKEAIQVIRINSNPFAAEYSEPAKGRVEIITKPGSGRLHGDLTFYFNDDSLNARNAFAMERRPQQARNYNGYLMGPVIRHRWDFIAYAGRWEQNETDVVNAITLDRVTLLPQRFTATVPTPARTTNFTIHTNYLLNKSHTLSASYGYNDDRANNQGLQSGLDLPERAYFRSAREDMLRFSLTSILNGQTLNEARMELARRSFGTRALNTGPAIIVLDGFSAGGNQEYLSSNNSSGSLRFTNNVTHTVKNHTFKVGFETDAVHLTKTDRSNFGGTFTFGSDFERDASGRVVLGPGGLPITVTPIENYRRTLMGLKGYRPSQFSKAYGDPSLGLSQWQMGWFAQDDWRVWPRLTLSYGLRHEFQTLLGDKMNFAPRVAAAFSPDRQQKSTVRAGVGVFYGAISPEISIDAAKLNGRRQRQVIIERPTSFPHAPGGLGGADAPLPAVHRKSDNLKAPYSVISTVSYERQLSSRLFGSASYSRLRGANLLRMLNVNAPQPGVQSSARNGPVLQFESTGRSTRQELTLGLRGEINRKLTLFGNYTLAAARSDTDGANTTPASSHDLSGEFGYAGFDERHRFFAGGLISLPWGLDAGPYFFATSGRPFNITTGSDNNGDTFFTDRPAFAKPGDPGSIVTRFGTFNPDPRPGDLIIPRNFGRESGQVSVSMTLSKTFVFGPPAKAAGAPADGDAHRRYNLTLSVEVDNLLNRTNLTGFNGVLTSPSFGKPNRALSARRTHSTLKFSF